jgi:hypothetical protein
MRPILVLAAASATVAFSVAAQEKPRQPPSSPKTYAYGTLEVFADPESGLCNPSVVENVLFDQKLARDAFNQIWPAHPKTGPSWIIPSFGRTSDAATAPGLALLQVQVESFVDEAPATKMLAAIRELAEARLQSIDSIDRRLQRLNELKEEQSQDLNRLAARKENLRRACENMGLPSDGAAAAEAVAKLDADQQSTLIQLQCINARREAVARQMDKIAREIAVVADKEPVVLALQKAAELRERALGALRKSQASPPELSDAESRLAELKAEIARNQREAADAAGGRRIAALRQRLEDADIEAAELAARLNQLSKRKERWKALDSLSAEQFQIEALEQKCKRRQEEIDRLALRAQNYQRPRVILKLLP